jgi:hypothetical protein
MSLKKNKIINFNITKIKKTIRYLMIKILTKMIQFKYQTTNNLIQNLTQKKMK